MPVDKNIKILVVDDSGTMRMMFKQMLKKNNFSNIVMAVDGKDATEKLLEENSISLIISDWNMPNMDGLELLKWVRANEKFKDIPFIMATAQGDKTQQAIVKDAGGNNHIAKPFTEELLDDKIENVFGMKSDEPEEKRKPTIINGKIQLKVGHIQITDHLVLGVLKNKIQNGEIIPKYFELETLCMPGWNPIEAALEKGDIDAAFVLAPIAMDLFAFDVPIKLISFAHKNGSSFVRSKSYNSTDYESVKNFYKYKVVNIPHKMSIHNMLAHKYLTELGLKPGVPGKKAIDVRFEVVPPIKMPLIMKDNNNVAGFIVAEPIASNAIAKGIADLQFISTSEWENHPCCVVAMQDDYILQYSDAVHEFVNLLISVGKYIEQNKSEAAKIAVNFLDPNKTLGLTTDILEKVLTNPQGIKMDDLYPSLEDLDAIQKYMHNEMGIGKLIDVDKFVDFQFADAANT